MDFSGFRAPNDVWFRLVCACFRYRLRGGASNVLPAEAGVALAQQVISLLLFRINERVNCVQHTTTCKVGAN
jgi:hypothetical protein